MKIKCVQEFRDKTTHPLINQQKKILVGDVIECDDKLANERIAKGLCIKVTEPKKKKVDKTTE